MSGFKSHFVRQWPTLTDKEEIKTKKIPLDEKLALRAYLGKELRKLEVGFK